MPTGIDPATGKPYPPEEDNGGQGTQIAGLAGAAIGGAIGGAGGAQVGKMVAETAAPIVASVTDPAIKAQRKMYRDARERQRTGQFGMSQAQQQAAQAQGNTAVASQMQQQQADIARAQAGGQLQGGAATEAQRAVAQQSAAANAQVAAQVQAASNIRAQAQYNEDQKLINEQAERRREFWKAKKNLGGLPDTTGNTPDGADVFNAPPGMA